MENKFFTLDDNFNQIIKENINEEIININFIPTGWTNIVYEVETKNNSYFFRFPRDEFWTRTIIKDYEFGKYINNKTSFNTIQLSIHYDNSRPFSMHKKIHGTPLAEKMNDLSEQEISSISKQISEFMYQLHNIKFDKNDIFTIDNIGLNLDEFLEELLKIHVSEEDRIFWDSFENSSPNCLVHGDLNSSNILLDENNNVTAIIDFGFGGFGNKYDDISRIIGRCPENFKNEIIKSYESISNEKLNIDKLDNTIDNWKNIDSGYINYMRKIGIYK